MWNFTGAVMLHMVSYVILRRALLEYGFFSHHEGQGGLRISILCLMLRVTEGIVGFSNT